MAITAQARTYRCDATGTVCATEISILAIHYAAGTTAGHTAVLTDGQDNPICTLSCGGNGFTDHIDLSHFPIPARSWKGLKVATLGSGVVTIFRG